MASSYVLGSKVVVPLQITEGGIAFTESASPTIVKIISPDNTFLVTDASMTAVDQAYGVYSYSFTPDTVGNYIVIITYEVDSQTYTTMEHVIIGTGTAIAIAPRAVAR